MYTVSYFEVHCDDGIPEATRQYFNTYHEAQAYAKSFDDWDDVRVDYLQVNTEPLPFWTHMARQLTGLFHCVLLINLMITIKFNAPYTGALRTQSFSSLAEAQSMIDFYASCGTRAWFA